MANDQITLPTELTSIDVSEFKKAVTVFLDQFNLLNSEVVARINSFETPEDIYKYLIELANGSDTTSTQAQTFFKCLRFYLNINDLVSLARALPQGNSEQKILYSKFLEYVLNPKNISFDIQESLKLNKLRIANIASFNKMATDVVLARFSMLDPEGIITTIKSNTFLGSLLMSKKIENEIKEQYIAVKNEKTLEKLVIFLKQHIELLGALVSAARQYERRLEAEPEFSTIQLKEFYYAMDQYLLGLSHLALIYKANFYSDNKNYSGSLYSTYQYVLGRLKTLSEKVFSTLSRQEQVKPYQKLREEYKYSAEKPEAVIAYRLLLAKKLSKFRPDIIKRRKENLFSNDSQIQWSPDDIGFIESFSATSVPSNTNNDNNQNQQKQITAMVNNSKQPSISKSEKTNNNFNEKFSLPVEELTKLKEDFMNFNSNNKTLITAYTLYVTKKTDFITAKKSSKKASSEDLKGYVSEIIKLRNGYYQEEKTGLPAWVKLYIKNQHNIEHNPNAITESVWDSLNTEYQNWKTSQTATNIPKLNTV